MICKFILEDDRKDFFKIFNLIERNEKVKSPIKYKGHNDFSDEIIARYLKFLLKIRKKKFNDKGFLEVVDIIYNYTLNLNPVLSSIKTEFECYAYGNPYKEISLDYFPGMRFPKLDIVLGVITGISPENIKLWVEIMRGTKDIIKKEGINIEWTDNGFALV